MSTATTISYLPEAVAGPSRHATPPRTPAHAPQLEPMPEQLPGHERPHFRTGRPLSDMGDEFARNGAGVPRPARTLSYDARTAMPRDRRTVMNLGDPAMVADGFRSQRSGLEWIVPYGVSDVGNANANGNGNGGGGGGHGSVGEKHSSTSSTGEKTVGARLAPTLKNAQDEKVRYEAKARMTSYALNACIGAQVLLGALTTGVAAATSGRQASIATSPEASTARCKDLEHFTRECEAFVLDYGHVYGTEYDRQIERFRRRFEEIMGNAESDGVGRPMQDKMRPPM
ncbi:hypothetical protein B0H21DRAFT_824096 [Amylocystis lapponica]|nr:hypothetical protein B0H21DRAFT_824096 [Amylocystis lapponica]